MNWLILDIAMVLILVLSCVIMAKQGFIKVVCNLTANIITIILVSMLLEPACEMILNTPLGETVEQSISKSIADKTPDFSEEVAENSISDSDFAPMIKKNLIAKGIEDTANNLNKEITDLVIKILTAIVLFILVRILVGALFVFINSVFRLPVLSKINFIAGGIAGVINALLIIYIACAIIGLNFDWAEDIRLITDDTFVFQHFYYNNVLIDLFIN